MIYYFTPQHPDGWGHALNSHCAIVPNPDDWICMVEADVMMFPAWWHQEVKAITDAHPQIDLFSAYATRTKRNSEAMYDKRRMGERDMVRLYETAMECWNKNRGQILIRQHSPAGFFYVFRRRLWDEIPFPTQGKNGEPNLNMDVQWAKRLRAAGKSIALMKALCCVHFYRMNDPDMSDEHLR